MPSQLVYIVVFIEAPQHVEHLGTFSTLVAAKHRASLHFTERNTARRLYWHDDPAGGARARHLHDEYLVRELEWMPDPPTPAELLTTSARG